MMRSKMKIQAATDSHTNAMAATAQVSARTPQDYSRPISAEALSSTSHRATIAIRCAKAGIWLIQQSAVKPMAKEKRDTEFAPQ
jgi:hypothetical protein